jgi:hypothetical protein
MNATFSFWLTYFIVPDNCKDCGETSGLRKKIAMRPNSEIVNEVAIRFLRFMPDQAFFLLKSLSTTELEDLRTVW